MPDSRQDRLPSQQLPAQKKPKYVPGVTDVPTGKPVQALQQIGYHGSLSDFSQRVHAVTDAHEKALGYKPSPAVALDVARSQVPLERIHHLFQGPRTVRTARDAKVVPPDLHPLRDAFAPESDLAYVKLAEKAIQDGTYDDYLDSYSHELAGALKRNPKLAYGFMHAAYQHRREAGLVPQGIVPGRSELSGHVGLAGKILLGIGTQSASFFGATVVGVPALGLAEYAGARQAVKDRSLRPLAKTQVELGKGVAAGVKQDVTHPKENAGFLAADVFGILTGAGGLTSRIGRAATAGSVKSAAKAVATRRVPGTVEVRRGGNVEHELELDNPLVAAAQRVVGESRNRNLERRYQAATSGVAAFLKPRRSLDALVDVLPAESKIGRLSQRRRVIEQALDDVPKRELEHVAKAAQFEGAARNALPRKLRRGLSIGEQKAIQVYGTDLVGDWEAKAGQWERFHENMIAASKDPQVIANHRAQLSALKLAEKAIENPSPRLRQALELTQEVIDRQERIKIDELGLSPVHAESRVASTGQVVRTGEKVAADSKPAKRVSHTSFYMPELPPKYTKKGLRDQARVIAGNRAGQYGLTPPQPDPALTHEYHGKAILAGDFRIDATNLASETYAKVVRLAVRKSEHKRHWDMGTETPRNVDKQGNVTDIPVRDPLDPAIPDELRELVNKVDVGEVLTADDAKALGDSEFRALQEFLYPQVKYSGRAIKGVRWVPRESLGPAVLNQAPARAVGATRLVQRGGQFVNEAFRAPFLYLRPAYALNAVSNGVMLAFEQGAWTGNNLVRAAMARKFYGERLTNQLDALAGEGHAQSYVNPEIESKFLKGGQKAAQFWHVAVDQWMRRASTIHQIQSRGYKGPEGLQKFFAEAPDSVKAEVGRRSKKAMVEFDNLTPVEQTYLRNLIFVYPWVSRSFVWSLRTLFEHPIKVGVLAHIGRDETDQFNEQLGPVVEWFKRSGYVPVGWDGDKPKVINGSQLSPFSTVRDMAALGEALFVGDVPYTSLADSLGPLGQVLLYTTTGQDQYGNKFKGADFFGAVKQLIGQTPQAMATQRGKKQNPPLPAVNVEDRETLVKREHAALKRVSLSPGWWSGFGLLMSGTLTPREGDPLALAARYWRDQPLEVRRKHEMTLVKKVLNMQAELIGRPLPAEVKQAVAVTDAVSSAQMEQAKTLGRDLTSVEQNATVLDVLKERGLLDDETDKKLRAQLKGMANGGAPESDYTSFRSRILARYGHGRALAQWQDDVQLAASFIDKQTFQYNLDKLAQRGVITPTKVRAGEGELRDYGRKVLAYRDELYDRLKEARVQVDPVKKRSMYAEIAAWQEKQDAPVGSLPSPVRAVYAFDKNDEFLSSLARDMTDRGWDTLPPVEKQLLGKTTPPKVAEAWAVYTNAITEYKLASPAGSRNLSRDQIVAVAKQVNKAYPGFIRDWQFAQQPLYERLRETTVYTRSEAKADWSWLFDSAAKLHQSAASDGGITSSQANDAWHDFVANARPWIEQNKPVLWAEIQRFERADPQFLFHFLER